MVFNAVSMAVAGLFMSSVIGAEPAPCPSSTVVVNVTSTTDVDNLMDVLACTGDGVFNITWYLSATIEETIQVSNNKSVTVTGTGDSRLHGELGEDNRVGSTIEAGGDTGIFAVSNGSTLRLNHLVLDGGNAENGGAVELLSSSSLFVFGCTFTNNNASYGGAIFTSRSAVVVDGNTTFENNSAHYGGAIYADESSVHAKGDSLFSYNTAEGAVTTGYIYEHANTTSSGGAIYVKDSEISIDGHSSFRHNSADYRGGAIFSRSSAVSIDGDSMFDHNSVDYRGGAIYAKASVIDIDGNTVFSYSAAAENGGAIMSSSSDIGINGNASFDRNSAGIDGASIYVEESVIAIDGNTTFTLNFAYGGSGGGVYALLSNVTMDGNIAFSNNTGDWGGGGVYTDRSDVYMNANSSAMFLNNRAQFGGGICMVVSKIGIDGSTISTNNSAVYDGGAMYYRQTHLSMSGTNVFVGNYAGDWGGAIRVYSESDIDIKGTAIFANNSAGTDGGALSGYSSNITIIGSKISASNLTGNEGALHSEAEDDGNLIWSVRFIGNSALALGGAMELDGPKLLQVSGATFDSNSAPLGGAVYVVAVDDQQTNFDNCVFEGNEAKDGGAFYLYTGSGVDIFTASIFRGNFAGVSGGAIYHTGALRIFNSTFLANKAGVEGAAIISIGVLETLSNVYFSENAYYCRAGEYGYVIENEDEFCQPCFDEVCARCSSGGNTVTIREGVRITGLPVCDEPPFGSTASSSGTTVETLHLSEGYYRTSDESHDVLKCYQENACLGGIDTDMYCTPGYEGPYCAVCADDYAPGIAHSCRRCSDGITRSAGALAAVAGVFMSVFAAFLLSHLGSVRPDREEVDTGVSQSAWKKKSRSCRASLVEMLPLTAIKIVVTVWQIISQFDAIAGDVYPELYRNFIAKLDPINLDLDFVFSYSCLVNSDFYDHLLVATIAPLIVMLFLLGSFFIGYCRQYGSDSAMRQVRDKHQAAALYVAFLVYSPVSYKIFQTFACDELDDGGTYLRADYGLSCLTYRHGWYESYALLMVYVYPIGIATVFAGLLLWHRRDLVQPGREKMLHLEPSKGLWAAYKPSRYYYEVVECARRIILTGIAAFVFPNSTAQLAIAFLVAVAMVAIFESISPFDKGIDMNLYRWGNGIIVASVYVAFLMRIDLGHDTTHALLTFSGVLVAANIFMVVAVLLQTALLVISMRGAKDEIKAVDVPFRRTLSLSVRSIDRLNEQGEHPEEKATDEFEEPDIQGVVVCETSEHRNA